MKTYFIGILFCVSSLVYAQNIDSECARYVDFAAEVANKNHHLPYDNSEFVNPIKKSDYLPSPVVTWTLMCDVFVDFDITGPTPKPIEVEAYAPNARKGWLKQLYLLWDTPDDNVFGVNLDWLNTRAPTADRSIFSEKEVIKRPDISDILKKYVSKNWNTGVLYQLDEADDHIEVFLGNIPEDSALKKYYFNDSCFMNLHQPNALYCTKKSYPTQQTITVTVYIVEEYS